MIKHLRIYSLLALLFVVVGAYSQGEAKKWYFGNYAGLDFNTNPPTAIATSSMPLTNYSYASIADANGNLLFYTNGTDIWDHTNAIMSNGSGIGGLGSSYAGSQRVIILKKPASTNIYYVVVSSWSLTSTFPTFNYSGGLYYSEVDMSLASGNGSVTVKNATISTSSGSGNTYSVSMQGKLTATRHCNGTDIWLVTREWTYTNGVGTGTYITNNPFRSYLFTSAGPSLTPVLSAPSTYTYYNNVGYNDWGLMKISPNGKKLGVAMYDYSGLNNFNNNNFEVYDFDNSTGVVSNPIMLNAYQGNNSYYSWGCEFSPDGTKFYGSNPYYTSANNGGIFQWDLCAGSATAIAASIYTVAYNNTNTFSTYYAGMQVAPDGRIYVSSYASSLSTSLSVINNPNVAGAGCNFVYNGQSISPKTTAYNLPNFMNSYFVPHPPPTPYTYTVSQAFGCQTASFNSIYSPSVNVVGCAATGYSVTAIQWDFGDPASNAANTSSLTNPSHFFSTIGTYTVKEILYYSCGASNDTIQQVVNINIPCLTVNSTSITCSTLGSATVSSSAPGGPFSYTWMPTSQSGSVATGLSPGVYTITVHDQTSNFTYTSTVPFVSAIPLTGNLNNSTNIPCNGVPTGSANVTNLAGGSGTVTYVWSLNGVSTFTAPTVNTLGAGTWNVIVTDVLTGCQINQTFFITQPPPLSLVMASGSPTVCAGASTSVSGVASGGTPSGTGSGYTYSWTAGVPTDTQVVSEPLAGVHLYTLTAWDGNNCPVTNTVPINYIHNPTITVSNVSICPLQTGTLVAFGASTYTWNNGSTGSTFTDNPLNDTQYGLTGSALGCTAIASASIILKPVPTPMLGSDSPVCNGQALHLQATGGSSYAWSGPLSFSSLLQNPVINAATPNHSGTYQATVTAANSCTASASITATVHPTPTISVSGSTVCQTQTLNLTANSFAGSTYQWTGPNAFSSSLQNPSIVGPGTLATGAYTVLVTSLQSCTNTAVTQASVVSLPVASFTTNSPRCETSTLTFTNTSTGAISYAWSGPNGFTSSLPSPTISNVGLGEAGIYTLVVTTGPCVVSFMAPPVIVYSLPVVTFTNNGPVCEGKPLHMWAASTATSYVWTGPSFSYGQPDTLISAAAFHNAGSYSVTATDIHGCASGASMIVSILSNPVVTASGDLVCKNDPSRLTAYGAVSYVWSGPGGYAASTSPATVQVTSAPGTYTVVGTAANTCTGSATADIHIQPLPQPSVITTPSVCVNGPITLQGFGGFSYVWTGPARFYAAVATVTFNAFSREASGGVYTLTVADSLGCKNYTTSVVDVFDIPDGSLKSSNVNHCVPFSSDFSLDPNMPISNMSWQIDGHRFDTTTFHYSFNKPGNYILYGTYSGSYCAGASTFMINAYDKPVAGFNFLPERPVETVDQITFLNTSTGADLVKWTWIMKDNTGNNKVVSKDAAYLYNNAGTYPVAMVVSNQFGCSDTIVKLITVDPDFNVYVPNTFTPNEDGLNELFYPVTRNANLLSFSVFDRWGTQLYSTTDPAGGWDGTYAGKPCKQDVYVWRVSVTGKNSEQRSLSGSVTLLR